MSLMIHKPAGVTLPERLLRAAGEPGESGYGLMGIAADGGGLLLQRRHTVDTDELLELERGLRSAEYVLHLGQGVSDRSMRTNVYPFEVSDGLYLMRNGALPLKARVLARSSTWHLVHELLRPMAAGWHSLFADPVLPVVHALLEAGLAPDNKVALLDYPHRRVVVINHRHGVEFENLWLSDPRCIDQGVPPINPARLPALSYRVVDLRFLH